MISIEEVRELNSKLNEGEPKEIISAAIELLPDFVLSFSGAEDVMLIDMIGKLHPKPAIFTLDTGRLHPETYQFLETVRKHYGLRIETLHPDPEKLSRLIQKKGLYSFYEDGHEECCGIRKVEPLAAKLATVDAWITGQRRDQSPARAELPVIEIDSSFSTEKHTVVKVNPLANWRSGDVWNYIRMFDVPYNRLHDCGFVSLGCEPCTRPIGPNQHEREGRWWWEESTIKECGLHRGNLDRTS